MSKKGQPLPFALAEIVLSVQGHVGWLVLNRPERRNALDLSMWKALPEAMARLKAHPDVRVIVIRGAGEQAFAAGADISEFAASRSGEAAEAYEEANLAAFRAIAGVERPVLAMIHGFCIGGGLAIALACDIRLAASDALFALPPARLGLAYPVEGLAQLLKAVSPAVAKEMIFSARRIDAQRALATGLVNAVHAPDELEQHTLALAADIATNAPLTIRHAKAAIDAISSGTAEREDERLGALAKACFDSADYSEGCRAFLEKRKPEFRGE